MEMDIDDQAQQLDEAKKEYLKPIVDSCFTHRESPYSYKFKENIPDVVMYYIIEELVKKYLQPQDPTKTLVQEFDESEQDASFWENRGRDFQDTAILLLGRIYRKCASIVVLKLIDNLATDVVQKNSFSETNTDFTEEDLKLLILIHIFKPIIEPFTKLLSCNIHPAIKAAIFRSSEDEDWEPTYAKESSLFKLHYFVVSDNIEFLEDHELNIKEELFSIVCSVLCNCDNYSVYVAKDAFNVWDKFLKSVDEISELVALYGHEEEILKILCDEFDPETKLNKSVKDKDMKDPLEDNDTHAERLESYLCGQLVHKFKTIKDPELLFEELKDVDTKFQRLCYWLLDKLICLSRSSKIWRSS